MNTPKEPSIIGLYGTMLKRVRSASDDGLKGEAFFIALSRIAVPERKPSFSFRKYESRNNDQSRKRRNESSKLKGKSDQHSLSALGRMPLIGLHPWISWRNGTMLKAVRKTRRSLWNFQRMLGSLTMFLEFFTGQWKRGTKKAANKVIGRKVARKLFLK